MRIGLVIGNLEDEYCNRIANFITQEISSLNANIVVFDCTDFDNEAPLHYVSNTLGMITGCECLDGIIIATSTFLCQNIEELIGELVKKTSIPVVSMGIPIEGIPSVVLDYTSAFDGIISHFISHDIKDFAYISGALSRPVFTLRYNAFLSSIKKVDLVIPPHLIFEATNDYMSGYNCAKRLAPMIKNGSVKGVICASDHLAISAIRYFAENNIAVPDDVKISGFDNTGNRYCPTPYLTTINRNLEQIFKKSISVLFEQIFGNNSSLTYYLAPELITGTSCGCENNSPVTNKLYIPWSRFNGLRATLNPSDSGNIIPKLTPYFNENNINQCYIVKYCNPIEFENPSFDPEMQKGILYYGFSEGLEVTCTKPFPTSNILPRHLLNEIKEPMLIRPIFINKITFGFLFISMSEYIAPLINDLTDELCQHLSGFYFVQEYMRLENKNTKTHESLMLSNKRLNELTVKDNLDKLVNVRHLASNMLQRRQGTTGDYILMIVEIDNYYQINERYGFSEGENVISCVSNILAGSIRDDDYLSHQSVERYVLLVKNIQQNPIKTIGRRFIQALDKLNQSIDKPYDISFCWGYAAANMDSNIDDAYRKAEEILLEEKQKRVNPS